MTKQKRDFRILKIYLHASLRSFYVMFRDDFQVLQPWINKMIRKTKIKTIHGYKNSIIG